MNNIFHTITIDGQKWTGGYSVDNDQVTLWTLTKGDKNEKTDFRPFDRSSYIATTMLNAIKSRIHWAYHR